MENNATHKKQTERGNALTYITREEIALTPELRERVEGSVEEATKRVGHLYALFTRLTGEMAARAAANDAHYSDDTLLTATAR